MLTFEQMVLRLFFAIILGAIIGLERELAGKEAGLRTNILVAAGACIFTIIGLSLPYLVSLSPEHLEEVIARNGGFLGLIANIVVGVGFLGAGIIIKHKVRVRGLTTAAVIWFVAAIGILTGLGLFLFAVVASIIITLILFLLRRLNLFKNFEDEKYNSF